MKSEYYNDTKIIIGENAKDNWDIIDFESDNKITLFILTWRFFKKVIHFIFVYFLNLRPFRGVCLLTSYKDVHKPRYD